MEGNDISLIQLLYWNFPEVAEEIEQNLRQIIIIIIIIWFVRLLALRPLLAYCASLG
jgi:hypothetical protein